MPSSSIESQNTHLQALLQSARPFLRGQLENIDSNLPKLIAVLKSVGAGECWHKHGSFLDHLIDIYRILKLWHTPDAVCLTGLFHSAYSNSYVNLAIFDPSTGRDTVREHVGDVAERLIHLFCIVPRQKLIHDDLLFKYDDITELMHHVMESSEKVGRNEEWRVKIRSVLPHDGIVMKHIKTGEDVCLSRRVVAVFLLMTIADFSDQLFGFQDVLFENTNGMLRFEGNEVKNALWPGNGKPGLWMSSLSRMGAIYRLIVREEELYLIERGQGRVEGVKPEEQIKGRGILYGKVFVVQEERLDLGAKEIYLSQGRFEEAEKESEEGLQLLLEWGSPWDKRMSWEGWIAWCRVLVMKAKEKSWPETSWGMILNLGLVR
ncbi:hypothetical protein Tco_1464845 [Tanacetum coccineum]